MKKTVNILSILTLFIISSGAEAQSLTACQAAANHASASVDQAIQTFQNLLSQADRSEPKTVENLEFLVMGLMSAKDFIQKQETSPTCQR